MMNLKLNFNHLNNIFNIHLSFNYFNFNFLLFQVIFKMNSNDIEEKLERDNLTIKEQILNLQNTIKKLKKDMLSSKESKQFQEDENKYQKITTNSNINSNTNNIIDDENENEKERERERERQLKFSFNNRMFQQENKNNINEDNNNFNNENEEIGNINYRDSNFSYKNSEETYGKEYLNNKKIIEYNNEEDYKGTFGHENNIYKNNNYKPKLINNENENIKKNFYQENIEKMKKEKELIEEMSKIKKKINSKVIDMTESLTDSEEIENLVLPNNNKKYIKEPNSDLYDLKINRRETEGINDEELQIEDLSKDSNQKKMKSESNFQFKKFYNKLKDDSFDNSDKSLDEKIKKLQKKKFQVDNFTPLNKNIKKETSTSKNNLSKKKILQRPKSSQRFNNIHSSTLSSNRKNNLNNLTKGSANGSKHTINSNNDNYNNNIRLNEIKSYKNEINYLKEIINKLKNENERLKKNLKKEKEQNEKYRQLTEEIIKHYEKTKKIK